jgi:membrane associated rhomboid family serine protease
MLPLFDNNKRRRAPVVTSILLAANLGLFVYELVLAHQGRLEGFIHQHAFTPALLMSDPGWETGRTIFTSMFLHGGWLHLISNLWFLWLFGNMVEDKLGPVRYLTLYFLSGFAAAGAQFAVGPFSDIPMIGASGAIAGVLGAYLFLFPTAIIFTFIPVWFAPIIPVPAFIFLVLWFLLQVWQGIGSLMATDMAGGVAWWAHLGGFAAGFYLIRKMRRRR